jgi:ATP-binding cassette, subfamily B, bacterial
MSALEKKNEEELKKIKANAALAQAEDEEEEEEEDGEEDEEEEEELPIYSATEAAGAFSSVFGFIKPFLGNHRKGLYLVLCGLLIETAFNVMMPISLKYLIDEVFEEGNRGELIWVLSVLAIAGISTSLVAIWYERQDAKVTSNIMADMRERLFIHIQNLPVSFYHKIKKGELLSRFSSDMSAVETTVIHGANWGVLPLLELVAGLALLFYLNWQLALVTLLIIPLTIVGPRLIAPYAQTASYDLKKKQAETLGVVQENISAQTVVKAFGLQKLSIKWYRTRNDNMRLSQTKSTFLSAMVERSLTISVLILHLIVLAAGAFLTFNGKITVGTFIAFENVFWEITYNISHLTHFIPLVITASGAVKHIHEVLDEPQRFSDKPNATILPRITKNLEFNNTVFSYTGEENQLKGLNLVLEANKRYAIVGPSGAGKSTLMNLVMRLYDPRSGQVLIDGTDISGVTRESLRAQMATVFQENVLFNTTFMENIRLGKLSATDEEVIAAAKLAEIHNFITKLPEGYNTMVGERGDTLSGGQRQRIAIARALVRNPSILLLDEATSALDQTTESAINKTLKKVGQGRMVMFITHRLTSVQDMDEVIVMDNGDVVERGTHDELLTRKKGLYKKLWDDQMRRG